MLADRVLERLMQLAQAVLNNARKANENWQRNAAPAERVDKLLEINRAIAFFRWVDEEVTVLADRKISFTPTGDIVKFGGIGGGPAIGWFTHLRANPGNFSGQTSGLLRRG